jgi:hypothetical protein
MEKLLKQLILNKSMLSNGSKFKAQCDTILQIIENMKKGWQGTNGCHNIDEMRAKMFSQLWLF